MLLKYKLLNGSVEEAFTTSMHVTDTSIRGAKGIIVLEFTPAPMRGVVRVEVSCFTIEMIDPQPVRSLSPLNGKFQCQFCGKTYVESNAVCRCAKPLFSVKIP